MDLARFNDSLIEARIEVSLQSGTKYIGREQEWDVSYKAETGSTNDILLNWLKSGSLHKESVVMVSDFQATGHGRLKRRWYCPAGMGLLFSVLQRIDANHENPALIGHLAALSLIYSLEQVVPPDCRVLWKWPNDVYLSGRMTWGKIAGILAQAVSQGTSHQVVLGIGVNILQCDFPSDLRQPATSMIQAAAGNLSKEDLLANILANLEYHRPLLTNGKELIGRLVKYDICGDEPVVCEFGDELRMGVVRGYGEDGAIWINSGKDTRVYHSGEIRIRPENFDNPNREK